MESNIKEGNTPLGGIIRLQLKKPQQWNWELTTSKSSPNISMPIFQLFDDHGNLLTEANDPNGCCRRSWDPTTVHKMTRHKSLRNSFHEHHSPVAVTENTNDEEKKYKLRSSKAGTLVVSDDSFEKRPRKHRYHLYTDNNSNLNKFGNFFENETLINATKPNIVHRKTKSADLGLESKRLPMNDNIYPMPDYRLFKTRPIQNLCDLSQSKPFSSLESNLVYIQSDKVMCTAERDSNHVKQNKLKLKMPKDNTTVSDEQTSTYIVQEPITPLSANVQDISNFFVKKKNRRKYVTKSENVENKDLSPSTDDDNILESRKQLRRRRKKKGDRILEIDRKPVSDLESATKQLQSASDGVLLRLARRIPSTSNHATYEEQHNDTTPTTNENTNQSDLNTMGANVSRHSGKGLSGRRTQSSGNICNRKSSSNVSRLLGPCATTDAALTPNQHQSVNVNRFCGSLPNNLDDTDSLQDCDDHHTNDNNNHLTSANSQITAKYIKKYHAPSIPTVQNFRQCDRNDYELRLQPLHVKIPGNNDTGLYDQGYGSERSPEDEYACRAMEFENSDDSNLYAKYPFITPETIFTVTLTKNSRGLGLSVTGGVDCPGPWSGLIRVKRLFPNQPAATCGLLSTGDLILAANGLTLTGLTNYEALEVLRTTPSNVVLTVCRPPPEILNTVSPLSDIPPPPPKRDPACSINLFSGLTPYEDSYNGEFDIVLTKVQGSLGFTLRKEDESALGHYVRALVREPALSDGRIKPGDKIVAVNDVELSSLSHEEAVQFLRQCGQEVKLRLYRDAAQTPVAALSPTEPDPPLRLVKPLRQEAVDMLSDLAVRKLSPCNNPPPPSSIDSDWQHSKEDLSTISNTNSAPRRCVRRTLRTTPDSDYDRNLCHEEKGSYKYLSSQVATSDSDSFSRNASFGSENNNITISSSNESEPERPIRPNFLNLGAVSTSAGTPINRKPKFQFSLAHNAYELNNLDADVLDAPNLTFTLNKNNNVDNEIDSPSYCATAHVNQNENLSEEPVSMPPMTSRGDENINNMIDGFNHKNPSYQSAHPKCGSGVDSSCIDSNTTPLVPESGSKGLLKWKGVVFIPDSLNDDSKSNIIHADDSDFEIITVELNRGWNSRLGFSLQQGNNDETFISAVHPDSVAARDGRLQPGDQLIRVNDENVVKMTTNEIIDLLRIVRGPVSIVIARKLI